MVFIFCLWRIYIVWSLTSRMFPGRKLDIVAVIRKSFFKIIILTFLNTLEKWSKTRRHLQNNEFWQIWCIFYYYSETLDVDLKFSFNNDWWLFDYWLPNYIMTKSWKITKLCFRLKQIKYLIQIPIRINQLFLLQFET